MDYRGKAVLAPMVRVSELPIRAMSLRYGADLVWSPEVVDKKIIASERVYNKTLDTVDFITKDKNKNTSALAFRTKPSLEKSKLVLQLGSADAQLAVEAAKKVARDISAIELNCGCPKHFSIHSGMGAALLQTPEKLIDILNNLVDQVGKPFNIAIHAKIRVLESAATTYDLVSKIVKTGISLLTVHYRTTPMRPREPAFYDYCARIAEICHDSGVACYVNGDIKGREDVRKFMDKYGVDGVMIARAAEENPSCFTSAENLVPVYDIVREFWAACKEYDYPMSHAKYCITKMLPGKDPLYQQIIRVKTSEMMDEALGVNTTKDNQEQSTECTESTELTDLVSSKSDSLSTEEKISTDLPKITSESAETKPVSVKPVDIEPPTKRPKIAV